MASNFSFLEELFPVLANFGDLAEQYCYSDSNSSLMKLGMIGETIVNLIFSYDKIPFPFDNTAVNRINTLLREGLLSTDLSDILHALRKARNKAVHENYASVENGKKLLPMAYSLCEWFMMTYGDWSYTSKPYVTPSPEAKSAPSVTEKQAEEEKEKALIKEAEEAAASAEKLEASERRKRAQKAASQRVKSEAETRYMIDEQLRKVGWEADTEALRYSKGTRPAKGRNIAIAEWLTTSSVGKSGFADYALFIGEKLVATIEAKASHKDIPSVIDFQCKEYSRGIRPEDAQYQIGTWGDYKVPLTFATNGRPYLAQYETKSGIWFLDLRQPFNAPKALHGWFSPAGIEEMLEKNIEAGNQSLQAMSYDLLKDKDGLNLHEYQLNAIKAAEKAIMDGQQNVLLAMATGTGKTRTVLGMIYRFLKTGRFRRILFLVDRNALGEQAEDVFKEVKLEELMTLDDIYNIKGLDDKSIDKETRVQIATVQSMVKRIVYNDDDTMPAVTDYDLIIVDEAHRGYILDREMGDAEILYRDQLDYQSKSLTYSLKVTDVSAKSKIETVFYFVLTTTSSDDDAAVILEKFDALLHRICCEHFTINTTWDDVSIYYAKKLYPLFAEVENLMRKIIYRFMIRIAGSNWFDNAVPSDVKNAVEKVQKKSKTNAKNADQLFYADFNQLGIFLFDKYTLKPFTQEFVEKLNKLFPKGEEIIDKEKLKNLLNSYEAKSNWERYFSDKIKVDGLKEKWDKLYSYRNQVAHTRRIKGIDYKEAKEIIDELTSAFNSCLDKIDTVNLTEEQSEAAQEFAKETVSQNRLNRIPGIISSLRTITDIASKLFLDTSIGLNSGLNTFLNSISSIQNQPEQVFEPQSMLNISSYDIASRTGVNNLVTS